MDQFSYIEGNYFMFLIIFLVPFLYLILKKFKSSSSSFPPGPTPWPIVGNILHIVGKMPHVALADLSKIHGPLMLLRLGTQNMVVASSPAAAKEILKTHDRVFSTRYVPKSVCIDQEECNSSSISMSETCSDRWNYLRTLCRAELFSFKALDAQTCLRERKMLDMIEHVKAKNVVNIRKLVFVTIVNIMRNILFSNDFVGFSDEDEDEEGVKGLFRKLLENFNTPNIADAYLILSKLDLQGIRKRSMKVRRKIKAIYEPIIQERRKRGDFSLRQNDFLDVLLLNKFTDGGILNIFLEMYLGAIPGSSTTIEWTMIELIKSPESMKKVIQELDNEVGVHLVKEIHLSKLSYLHACIKETLRLHPPSPLLIPRRASEACQVMNYTIPKNAPVYINAWAMGRDPSIWNEPLMFTPERFLNVTVDFKGNNFEFTPFGGGRRICPGLPMVGRHLPLILATLLHSFDWSLPKEMSSHELLTEKFGISLQNAQPLQLIPKLPKGT